MSGPATATTSTALPLPYHAALPRQLRRRAPGPLVLMLLLLACFGIPFASAARISFDNCLGDAIYSNKENQPDNVLLQFVPLVADAVYESHGDSHNLLVTVWGNVTGRLLDAPIPLPGDPEWDTNSTKALNGKIQNTVQQGQKEYKATTLHSTVNVLQYRPQTDDDIDAFFCQRLINGSCPLGPVFHNTTPFNLPEEPYGLPAFNLTRHFGSSYAFASFSPTLIIRYGNQEATTIGCISTTVTPSLGDVAWYLTFLPLAVLISVGFATVFAAVFSPWGTTDVFHWTSNYGRDPDLLRLVTPGFGDCLNYIQFVVLTGSLSLNYPGFYQPAVSQGSWSVLMFNQSFASNADPFASLVDGIYVTTGPYGLARTAQLVGLSQFEDIWVSMIIWTLVIIAGVLFITQASFLARWVWRFINRDTEEDLRSKNIPFSSGTVIRIVFSYFLLPIVALSAFQFVVADRTPGYVVALSVITLVLTIGFAGWLIRLIATTKPRAHLFDDLPTVLLYGPLYNTFSDEASGFAAIPIILTILRGIAIGAVQPSGTAQIVILAVCEVIQILTLQAFRPFHPSTSMNAYHFCLSALRFITIILMVTFTSSLGLTDTPKGWIGYAILLIHGAVLVFGFFLNALQTIVEVIARLCGAGGDDVRGQTRGGLSKIFGARQLSRRVDRASGPSRLSQLSSTAMLNAAESTSKRGYGRVRSGSAASMGIMMSPRRNSSAMDTYSIDAYSNYVGSSTLVGTTPSTFSILPSPGQATRPQSKPDPYYRPPRARGGTIDEAGPSSLHRTHDSLGSIDLGNHRLSQYGAEADGDVGMSGRANPSFMPYTPIPIRTDYSTREVDFYYGVRGPALNSDAPGRRLGTGPADPTSPVATATGWLMRFFGGKTKEKGKGFEVVRSARMPPAMKNRGGDLSDDAPPEGIPVALGVLRKGPIESDDDEDTPTPKTTGHARAGSSGGKLLNDMSEPESDEEDVVTSKLPEGPPLLPDLDDGERFVVPSRTQSKASRHPSQRTVKLTTGEDSEVLDIPDVPRKSSKRNSQLIAVARLPFDRSNSHDGRSTEDLSRSVSAQSSVDGADERPVSFGAVHQRSPSKTEPLQDVDLLASTAEVVSGPAKPSRSLSKS